MRQKCTHQAERQGVENGDQANNDIWSRVLGSQKERLEQIACSRYEDAAIDTGQDKKVPYQKSRPCKMMPKCAKCQHS